MLMVEPRGSTKELARFETPARFSMLLSVSGSVALLLALLNAVSRAGETARINDQLVMAFVSGLVVAVDPATGEVTNSMEIGRPIAHPPVEINGKLFVTGADGTLHQLTDLML